MPRTQFGRDKNPQMMRVERLTDAHLGMQNQLSGRYAVNEIAFELGFNVNQKSALKDGLKKKRKVFDDLAVIGVAYVVEGKSKGAKSYLVKNG